MHLRWIVAVLVGCVPSRSTVFDPVDREVQHRVGLGVTWPEESRTTAAIDALLAKPIDIDAAVRIALARNHRLQARFDELGIAASQVADATVLPPLTADADYKRALTGSGSEIEVAVVQDVLDLVQIGQRRGIANAELHGAQVRAIAATVEMAADVEMAFNDLIAAQQELELVQTAFDTANASADLVERQHEAGNTTHLALAREQEQRERARIEIGRARQVIAERHAKLAVLLGARSDQTWTATGHLSDPPATVPILDDLAQVATSTNLDLEALRADIDAAEAWMEMKSRRGSSDALRALFDLVPPKTHVVRGDKEIEIPTTEVVRDDMVVLRPGDRVPVDGEVVEGTTSIDESLVTGESLPVEKKPGEKVVGGSVNGAGTVKFKATGVGEDTTLARIAKLVATAQSSKAPGQRLADKAAAYLVVLAVGAGLATFVAWRWGGGVSFVTSLTFAISAVVIACPDALGLATPTAVAVGTGVGAKHNILIKDATTLEGASRITAVAFDKTGTLTEGKPRVVDVVAAAGVNENDAMSVLAAAERGSSHPLAAAILEEAKRRNLGTDAKVDQFENVSGHGLKAVIAGKRVLVGNARFLKDQGVDLSLVTEAVDRLLAANRTLILLAMDGKPALVIGVTDPIKPSAKRAVAELRKLGIETAMISGDNKAVAEAVGKEIGIDRVFAEVPPEDKAAHVKTLQSEKKFVAMVGDGVNDAPALAQADIGIAIGAGTDVAIEAAKIVLMKSDPLDVLNAIILSKATVRKMKQNLVWASVYNLLAIPIAAGVFYPVWGWSLRPEISALLMSASSIIVAVNAVMLRRSSRHLLVAS